MRGTLAAVKWVVYSFSFFQWIIFTLFISGERKAHQALVHPLPFYILQLCSEANPSFTFPDTIL